MRRYASFISSFYSWKVTVVVAKPDKLFKQTRLGTGKRFWRVLHINNRMSCHRTAVGWGSRLFSQKHSNIWINANKTIKPYDLLSVPKPISAISLAGLMHLCALSQCLSIKPAHQPQWWTRPHLAIKAHRQNGSFNHFFLLLFYSSILLLILLVIYLSCYKDKV